MDLETKVRDHIIQKCKESNGSCGIPIPSLVLELNVTYALIKPILKNLYEQKFFYLREGLNGKLIFKKR